MRLINSQEIQNVSGGGVGIEFVLSFASGMQGYSFGKTVLYSAVGCALFYGVVSGITVPIIGFPFGVAVGGFAGGVSGAIGYGLGSLFYNPQPQVQIAIAE